MNPNLRTRREKTNASDMSDLSDMSRGPTLIKRAPTIVSREETNVLILLIISMSILEKNTNSYIFKKHFLVIITE